LIFWRDGSLSCVHCSLAIVLHFASNVHLLEADIYDDAIYIYNPELLKTYILIQVAPYPLHTVWIALMIWTEFNVNALTVRETAWRLDISLEL